MGTGTRNRGVPVRACSRPSATRRRQHRRCRAGGATEGGRAGRTRPFNGVRLRAVGRQRRGRRCPAGAGPRRRAIRPGPARVRRARQARARPRRAQDAHRLGGHCERHTRAAVAGGGSDGGEKPGPLEALVAQAGQTLPLPPPAMTRATLLADPVERHLRSIVLEPQRDPLSGSPAGTLSAAARSPFCDCRLSPSVGLRVNLSGVPARQAEVAHQRDMLAAWKRLPQRHCLVARIGERPARDPAPLGIRSVEDRRRQGRLLSPPSAAVEGRAASGRLMPSRT